MIAFALGLVAGGAAIWFGKDKIQSLVIGANAFSVTLHAKADAIVAAARLKA
jgi:hypothetical protein